MPPVILAVTRSRLAATTAYDEIIESSTQTLFENAAPDHSIFVYVYGLATNFSVKTEGSKGLTLAVLNTQNRNDILPPLSIPGLGGVKELEVRVPASQALRSLAGAQRYSPIPSNKRAAGAQRYGPVLFTKITVIDVKNGASNPWPLCILLKVPTILGVTTEQVTSGTSAKPADVYADLLKKNLANLVKGTSPGHVRRGSGKEDPPPDVYIYGCNFDFSSMTVKPADIPTLGSLLVNKQSRRTICTVEFDFSIGPLQKKFQFDLQEIGISLPTMADLQNSGNYLRNAVLMAFGVQVVNGRGSGEESNVWQWPMWLPMPSITAIEPDKGVGYGNGRYLGNETSGNDQGEVRWYLASPFNPQRKPLGKYVQGVAEDLQKIARIPFDELSRFWSFEAALKDKKTIVLPKPLAEALGAIRDAGELCDVDHGRPDCWADDTLYSLPPFEKCYRDACGHEYDPEQGDPGRGVEPWTSFAQLPADWVCPDCGRDRNQFVETGDKRYKRRGFAVVWRGDIPSLPLPIKPIEYVKDLARRLWRPVMDGAPDFTLPIPVPAAKAVKVGVERLEDVANDLLGRINTFDQKGYGLRVGFAFITKALDTSNFKSPDGSAPRICTEADKDSFFFDWLEPTKTGVGGKLIEFLFNPLVGGEFDLQLHVFIQGKLRLLDKDLDIPPMDFPIGPRLRFQAERLDLPTAAIFFQTSEYGGAALVALEPKWLGGEVVRIDVNTDVNTPGNPNQIRVKFIAALSRAYEVLDVVKHFSDVGCLDQIVTVIGNICAIGRSVIDSSGKIENVTGCVIANKFLGEIFGNSTFNDDISSVVMIGPPHSSSHTVIKCWQHSLNRPDLGACLKLKMPDSQFVFTIPNFADIRRDYFDPNTLGPIPPTQSAIDFDNRVTGIEFVTE
jgi:rubredoxin